LICLLIVVIVVIRTKPANHARVANAAVAAARNIKKAKLANAIQRKSAKRSSLVLLKSKLPKV
jgi:uncharacterized membrane protein